MTLQALGSRICIIGPSNSGKSTLAAAIGCARALEVVHLDRLYHLPHSDWEPRPRADFLALHDDAITGERWVMDGNYSECMTQRLARATGLILLDIGTMTSLRRYFRRTIWEKGQRIGALDGGHDSVKWDMIRHIGIASRASRKRYAALFRRIDLPRVGLRSAQEIDGFYVTEKLERARPARPAA